MRVASGPDPPGSSRCVFERRRTSVPRVCLSATLATPAPSGSTDTSWLCRGRLPPIPAPPGTGCPQLHRPAATGRRRRSLTSTQSTSASRRTGGRTHALSGPVDRATVADRCRTRGSGQDPGRRRRRSQVCRPEPVRLLDRHQRRLPHGPGVRTGPRTTPTLLTASHAVFAPVAHTRSQYRIARTGDGDAFGFGRRRAWYQTGLGPVSETCGGEPNAPTTVDALGTGYQWGGWRCARISR